MYSMREVLDERKKRILQAVTDDYISTGEPVGSRTIARRYALGISPATIRNEMADLEESGYLEQPHTSAGRIPSDKGYRFYVDSLMKAEKLARAERERIRRQLERYRREVEAVIHQAAAIMADLTQYVAIVLAPRFQNAVFKHIELVPLDAGNILVILVTSPGFVESRVVDTGRPVSLAEAERIAKFLNERLRGLELSSIGPGLLAELESELEKYRTLLEGTVDLIVRCLEGRTRERVYTEGMMNIFSHPEFRDIDKVKPLFSALSQEKALFNTLALVSGRGPIEVIIGKENPLEEMKRCSIVGAMYGISGQVIGALGVLGPTRMDYARVTGLVEFISATLTEILTETDRR